MTGQAKARKTGTDKVQPWRALRHRNFRLFFFGQSVSVIGTWMTRLATTWLVYRLTHSALLLGVVTFAGQIIAFLLGPLAGVWVERLPRRPLLLWTQAAAAVQSLALAALTISGHINLTEVIGLTALQGVINAFDMPGRQSFLSEMIEGRADLSNAIAINASIANGARLIGPALAGFVIGAVGEGWCFLIDGVSYFAVIGSLLLITAGTTVPSTLRKTGVIEELTEGWRYVSEFRPIRSILLLFSLVSFMGYSYSVLLPVFAAQILHGNASTLGWLSAASGVGAVVSGLSLTMRRSVVGLARVLQVGSGIVGVACLVFGFSHQMALSAFAMVFAGFGLMQTAAISNTLIQTLAPEDKRARVMSYYTTAFFGAAPIGGLIGGTLAHWIGAPETVAISGLCCIAGSLWFAAQLPSLRAEMRPIYQKLGILPPRLESAAEAGAAG